MIFASALAVVACNKAVIELPNGYLDFNVSADDIVVETRAVSDEVLADYNVVLVGQWTKKYSEIKGKTFTLPAATYSLYAENVDNLTAETGNGALRVASESVSHTVSANETATATLNCVAQSSKLTLKYSDRFKEVFSGYTFTVKKKDGTTRQDGTENFALSENSSVYYNGSVALVYTLTGTHETNGEKTYGGEITLTKGHSLTINVDQNSQSGGLGIIITADDSLITDTDLGITVDPYKE